MRPSHRTVVPSLLLGVVLASHGIDVVLYSAAPQDSARGRPQRGATARPATAHEGPRRINIVRPDGTIETRVLPTRPIRS